MNKASDNKKNISWKTIARDNVYSLCFMWRYSKSHLILALINTVICGAVGPAEVILTSRLLNMLESGCTFSAAVINVLLMAAAAAAKPMWSLFYNNILAPRYQQKLHLEIQKQFFEKVRTIELSRYDDPAFYNEFVLAMQNADSLATMALGNLSGLIGNVFSLAATVSVIAYVDVIAMVIMLASALFSMLLNAKMNKIGYENTLAFISIGRKDEYIGRVFRLPDFAKELRLTDLGDKLIEDYDKNIVEHIKKTKFFGKKKVLIETLNSVNNQGVRIAVIGWTLYKLLAIGSVTLGGFTVVVNANWRLREAIVGLGGHISSLPQQSMYIEKVRMFMEYKPEGRSGTLPAPAFEELELSNVTFGYNKDATVLRGINMKIRRGEKIAIAGYNGAGKSTLIKLMMYLYQPNDGVVLYNGVDIKEYETDSYRSHIGAVFQDFKIFAATIAENVLGDEYIESEYDNVKRVLEIATFDDKLDTLPDGICTMLTREFDESGTELSGGEAQKVAIARVFAEPYEIIIMDEPSSSLDPVAEYKLNKHISGYTEDKTVIFISHRLSTTRYVDRIYMLEEGRIIESGSHSELMKLGGKYAEMFKVQAEKYGIIQ